MADSSLRGYIRAIRQGTVPTSLRKDPKQLQPYEYRPLRDAGRDIRIVELLPGQFDDSVRVKIHHASLLEPPDVEDSRMPLDALQGTMPKGWEAVHTIEDRYLFWNYEENSTSWEHPDGRLFKYNWETPKDREKSDPHYEALSYVWGSDQKPQDLTVEGLWGSTQIPITDSLMAALRHLRGPKKSRKLWIDALCINQSDLVEVASQVQRMGLIYKLAYRVVVWLGPQSDDTAHAFATLEYLSAQVEVDERTRRFPAPFAEHPTWHRAEEAFPYAQPTWDSIHALLQRPWFERVWIVQEIQLGSKRPGPIFQCGFETIERSKLYKALYCLSCHTFSSTTIRPVSLRGELTTGFTLLKPMVDFVFWDIIHSTTADRLCKDARDKVYGIIGLLPKRFASKIKVDYGTNNTTSQVYKKTFVAHAQQVERLELFPQCFITGRSILDAPSWVPDWSSTSPTGVFDESQFATGTSRAHFKYTDEEPDLLEVLGVSCAVVSHVSDYLPTLGERQAEMDHLKQWQPRDLGTAIYGPTGEPLRKAYACTLIENSVVERHPDEDFISTDEWVDQAGSLFGDCASSPGGLEADDLATMDRAIRQTLDICDHRSFVQTHEGYIGLAPAETRPGDVVAIFLGCSNPMVLRPQDGRYSIVGESFIYGLEDATKLLGPLPEPWRVISKRSARDLFLHYFFNPQTGKTTREDPRLEPLPEWSRIRRKPDGDDPIEVDFFENQETSIVVNYDPRLEPEMLEKRGVQLKWFTLV